MFDQDLVTRYFFSMNFFKLVISDFKIIKVKDPAAHNFVETLLCHHPFYAILTYRIAHVLHKWKIPVLPRFMCQFMKIFTGVEIHPGAKIGKSFFIDHGTGTVIGETAEIGDRVAIFQGVTLGGRGHSYGKRHPTLKNDVLIGANAILLGPIVVGDGAIIGAASVVLQDVPDHATVVGNPGRVVKIKGERV